MIFGQTKAVNGLVTSVASNTTLSISSGNARDTFNVVTLVLPGNTIINAAINGINGLDTGSLGASSIYAVYIIGDQEGLLNRGVLLSLDATLPLLPVGYDAYRRIGWAITNGSSHFIQLTQSGDIYTRTYTYNAPLIVLSGGNQTSYTAVDLTGFVPPINCIPVVLASSYTPNSGGNFFSVRPPAATTSTLPSQIATQANVIVASDIANIASLVMGAPKVEYLVQTGDTLDLYISAFDDFFIGS